MRSAFAALVAVACSLPAVSSAMTVVTVPLSTFAQPSTIRLSDDAVKRLPRVARDWSGDASVGVVKDAATWKGVVADSNGALAEVPAIDFEREVIVFVVHETHGGGGDISIDKVFRDWTSGARLSFSVKPATLDIAYTSRNVAMVRLSKAEATRLRFETRGSIFADFRS